MVGTITNISGGSAYVEPDDSLSQTTRRKLGWTDESEDSFRLRKANIDSIDADAVHLKSAL
jgi:hypothetical protein